MKNCKKFLKVNYCRDRLIIYRDKIPPEKLFSLNIEALEKKIHRPN